MMTKTERDQEDLINGIINMARQYRAANRLFDEDPITVDIPPGQWHLVTQRDLELLKVLNIHVGDEARIR